MKLLMKNKNLGLKLVVISLAFGSLGVVSNFVDSTSVYAMPVEKMMSHYEFSKLENQREMLDSLYDEDFTEAEEAVHNFQDIAKFIRSFATKFFANIDSNRRYRKIDARRFCLFLDMGFERLAKNFEIIAKYIENCYYAFNRMEDSNFCKIEYDTQKKQLENKILEAISKLLLPCFEDEMCPFVGLDDLKIYDKFRFHKKSVARFKDSMQKFSDDFNRLHKLLESEENKKEFVKKIDEFISENGWEDILKKGRRIFDDPFYDRKFRGDDGQSVRCK